MPFGVEKLELWGYPTVKKNFEDIYNRLDSIPACDRQTETDGPTSCHGIVRAMHTRRAYKTAVLQQCVLPKNIFITSRAVDIIRTVYYMHGA